MNAPVLDPFTLSVLSMMEARLKLEDIKEYNKYIKLSDYEKLEYITRNKAKLDVEFNNVVLNEVRKLLLDLLKTSIDTETNKELEDHYLTREIAAFDNVLKFRKILFKYNSEVPSSSLEEESMLSLAYHNLIVESIYMERVNLIIYLLVHLGTAYYILKNGAKHVRRNVKSINDIRNEPLSRKLAFLTNEGFGYITSVCDRYLRNSVAHMDYVVEPDGTVNYSGHNRVLARISHAELNELIISLLDICQCITLILKEAYEESGKKK